MKRKKSERKKIAEERIPEIIKEEMGEDDCFVPLLYVVSMYNSRKAEVYSTSTQQKCLAGRLMIHPPHPVPPTKLV